MGGGGSREEKLEKKGRELCILIYCTILIAYCWSLLMKLRNAIAKERTQEFTQIDSIT